MGGAFGGGDWELMGTSGSLGGCSGIQVLERLGAQGWPKNNSLKTS